MVWTSDSEQTQEWWVERTADGDWSLGVSNRGFALFDEESVANAVRDVHNAALAAVREKVIRLERANHDLFHLPNKLREELVTIEHQLLQAQAAISNESPFS